MQARTTNSQGLLSYFVIDQICKIGITPVNMKNSDASTFTAIVVEKRYNGMYKLACKHGTLKNFYFRPYLESLTDVRKRLMDF